VLAKGEPDDGTILVVMRDSRTSPRLFERMPQVDGTRPWTLSKTQDIDNMEEFEVYLERRRQQDPDTWIIELDIPNPERFILESG